VATTYFLDTNILIHLIRRDFTGEALIQQYNLYLTTPRPLISDVSEGELRSLALQWNWGKLRLEKMEFLLSYFWRISINTPEVFNAYASIDAYSESLGISMGKNDLWIAASVYTSQAHLLTTDKDFNHLQSTFISRDLIDLPRTRN
jgi:tRNA(fMet)-specific endonuclease VapC